VSELAKVRCPHCAAEFIFGELLDSQYPTWEILDDSTAGEGVAFSSDTYNSEISKPAERDRELGGERFAARPAVSSRQLETSQLEADDLKVAEPDQPPADSHQRPRGETRQHDWSAVRPLTYDQFERLKRKNRSPIWSILQVALGGLAAIPIALLLIWHVIGTDIADAGPWVGQYAPWIVPKKFRPMEPDFAPSLRSSGAVSRGDSGFRQFDDVFPLDSGADSDNSTTEPGPRQLSTQLPSPTADDPTTGSTRSDDSGTSSTAAELARGDAQDTLDLQAYDRPTQNIFASIRQCEQHLDEWAIAMQGPTPDINRKDIAQAIYADLIQLALSVDQLPFANPVLRTISDQMQPIGRAAKRRSDVQDLIQQGSQFWLKRQADSAHFGLAIIVEISDVHESEDSWEIIPSGTSAEVRQGMSIHVPKTIAPALMAGQKLLLLGVVDRDAQAGISLPEQNVDVKHEQVTHEQLLVSYLHAL
jgi:hypothetical protein